MRSKLLDYYQQELYELKKTMLDFAKAHPHLAGFISANNEQITDPHINQLLEGVAFLNSRVFAKLDDGFSQISTSLLDMLSPNYLAPMPSITVLEVKPYYSVSKSMVLPKGQELRCQESDLDEIRFQTCFDLELMPLKITDCKVDALKREEAPSGSMITWHVKTLDSETSLPSLSPTKLRVYLHGDILFVERLYQALLESCNHILIMPSLAADAKKKTLLKSAISAVGFDDGHSLLPLNEDFFKAHRLLGEFFSFPQKFWFIDIEIPKGTFAGFTANEFFISMQLDLKLPQAITKQINNDTFKLNCVPIVNLFKKKSEVISLNHIHLEYPVIMDSHNNHSFEIFSIDEVTVQVQGQEESLIPRLYSVGALGKDHTTYWWPIRKNLTNTKHDSFLASNLSITFVDGHGARSTDDSSNVIVSTTCCNGNIPSQLFQKNKWPQLYFYGSDVLLQECAVLTAPTPMRHLAAEHDTYWSFIAHISLNQADLTHAGSYKNWLETLFELYDFDSEYNNMHRSHIKETKSCRIMAKLPDLMVNHFCFGTQLTIELSDDHNPDKVPFYLLGSVLEKFIAGYNAINTFSKLNIRNRQGVIKEWPVRTATTQLTS